MPNSRRTEIIRFVKQAHGNAEDCGGFLWRAMEMVSGWIDSQNAESGTITEQHLALREMFEFQISSVELLVEQLEALIEVL